MEWLVDPFNQGELTALEDAEEVLGKLIGYQVGGCCACFGFFSEIVSG
jgi:hypothetical protein